VVKTRLSGLAQVPPAAARSASCRRFWSWRAVVQVWGRARVRREVAVFTGPRTIRLPSRRRLASMVMVGGVASRSTRSQVRAVASPGLRPRSRERVIRACRR